MVRKAILGRVSDVDIRLLRIFHTIVRCGGIAAAELELNIGRSTISRHLSDLEIRLGLKLCTRGPAGFALTAEGQRVINASSRLLSAINTFQADVNETHRQIKGTLAIALFDKTISNPQARISQTFTLFEEIAPQVQLELYMEPTHVIESGVLSGRFDIGFIPTHRKSSSLAYYPIYKEQMNLYCGAGHPLFSRSDADISSREVKKHKYAGLGFHSPNMIVSKQRKLLRSADVYDQEALATLILSGCYIGFLPDHYVEPFVRTGLMRALLPETYHYQSLFAAILRQTPKPNRLQELFLDCVQRAHGDQVGVSE